LVTYHYPGPALESSWNETRWRHRIVDLGEVVLFGVNADWSSVRVPGSILPCR
jgi:hypothetical protein